jgi:serine/threonine protein kinase
MSSNQNCPPPQLNNQFNNLNSNYNLCGNNNSNGNFNNNNIQNNQNYNNIEKPIEDREILNILKKARFKISGFGLSKLNPNNPNKNVEVNRYGSPLYMSPELFLKETSLMTVEDQKVDIWALGVLAFEMFYGRRPFEAGSIDQLSRMYAKGKYYLCSEELNKKDNTIKKIYKKISKEFVEFLNLCLQKNPKERATAVELTKTDFYNMDYNDLEKLSQKELIDILGSDSEDENSTLIRIDKKYFN